MSISRLLLVPCGNVASTWINPHIKGPEDKPLKLEGPRVFGVIR